MPVNALQKLEADVLAISTKSLILQMLDEATQVDRDRSLGFRLRDLNMGLSNSAKQQVPLKVESMVESFIQTFTATSRNKLFGDLFDEYKERVVLQFRGGEPVAIGDPNLLQGYLFVGALLLVLPFNRAEYGRVKEVFDYLNRCIQAR